MFCTQCGTKLDENAKFCISCGKPTGEEPPPAYSQAAYSAPYEPVAAVPGRKLRRIRAQKKVSGVCAGFAEYFDMDVTLMRIIWLGLLLLPPHIGAIAYIICMMVLPKS